MPQTVGFLEVTGLAGAIQAADAAVKAADVKLVGYELSKGYGLVTVKITGDVAAVKAAVEAGAAAVTAGGGNVHSKLVIPRPAGALKDIVYSRETVPPPKSGPIPPAPDETDIEIQTTNQQELGVRDTAEPAEDAGETDTGADSHGTEPDQGLEETGFAKYPEDICNLCGDPLCPRRKGEPRANCIHFEEL